jgi:hypothetical protein
VEAGNPFAIAAVEKAPKCEWPYHYHAFGDLSTERQYSMAAGPIPNSAITAYAFQDRLTLAETDVLHFVIRALDNHFLDKTRKASEKVGK